MIRAAVSLALLFAASAAEYPTYKAVIEEIPGSGSGVNGTVVVFTYDNSTLAYAGIIDGLMPDLTASDCTAINGCGVHIHLGTDCFNSTTQGGHYYVDPPVTTDPWTNQSRYFSTDADGKANFAGLVDIGTEDVAGRAFVVHSDNGTRVGCGLLEPVTSDALTVTTENLTDAGVTGEATVYAVNETACFFGAADNLEPELLSYSVGGSDCNYTNGCGVHIHAGFDCYNSTTQAGHFYNTALLTTDPWARVGYVMTDAAGVGYFVGCVETGETTFASHAFVVHSNNGSRVSCGLLELANTPIRPTSETPTSAAPSPASAAPSSASDAPSSAPAAPSSASASPASASPSSIPVAAPVSAPDSTPVAAPVRAPAAAPVRAPVASPTASASAHIATTTVAAALALVLVVAAW